MLGFLGHVLGHRGPWETLGVMTLGILGTGWGAGRLCCGRDGSHSGGAVWERQGVGFQHLLLLSKWHELYQLLKQKKTKLYPNHEKMPVFDSEV